MELQAAHFTQGWADEELKQGSVPSPWYIATLCIVNYQSNLQHFMCLPGCEPLEVKDVVFPVLSLDLLQSLEHSRHLEDVISKWINRGEKTSTEVYDKLEKQKYIVRPPEGTEGTLGLRQ